MPIIHSPNSPETASEIRGLGRRAFLAGSAAVAIAAPAVVLACDEIGLAASTVAPEDDLALDRQLEMAIVQLRAVLAKMHSEVDETRHSYIALNNGRSYAFWLVGHAPALTAWDGPGLYEVAASQDAPAGTYHIERTVAVEDGGKEYLYGAMIFGGFRVAPRCLIEPSTIISKLDEPSQHNCQPPRRNMALAIDG